MVGIALVVVVLAWLIYYAVGTGSGTGTDGDVSDYLVPTETSP